MKVKVVDFPSAYHGILEVGKVKEKYLKKVLEKELSRRSDIPQPFAFSYKVYEEMRTVFRLSVCVVSKEKVDEVIKSCPDVTHIFTEEVAFSSYLMKHFSGPAWGAIVKEREVSLFLYHEGCVVYSTRVPIVSGFDEVFVESVNSVLRYAVGMLGHLPEKFFLKGSVPDEILDSFILDTELVDWNGEVFLEFIEDYNLLPDEIKTERRTVSLYRFFAFVIILINFVLLGYCGYLIKNYVDLKREIAENDVKIERLKLKYERLERLKKIYEKKKRIVEAIERGRESLAKLNHLYAVFSYLVGEGIQVKEAEIKGDVLSIRGVIKAKSKAMAYLRYLDVVNALASHFKILKRDFAPGSGTFYFSLELS